MTEITPQEAFKSKAKFSEFMADENPAKILSTLADYPKADGKAIITLAELTQSTDALIGLLQGAANLAQPPFLVWIITNEKETLIQAAYSINKYADNKFGLFIFKASLIEDKIEYNCLLKPEIKQSKMNTKTPAKTLQLDYWQKYFEICDKLMSEMQVNPKPQHYQYISVGKAGVQIMQIFNTQENYIATDILINSKQEIFNKLIEHKAEIETELGKLDWQALNGKKSSKIRLKFKFIEINDELIRQHIEMAEKFKATFIKYL